jgi:hypothetical protein
MNQRKLFPIVAGGYRTIIKKALISDRYPLNSSDSLSINPLVIVSGDLADVPTFDEELYISPMNVVEGRLELFEFPIYNEQISVSPLNVLSCALNTVVITAPTQTEPTSISLSQLSILSGVLNVVVVNIDNQTELPVSVSQLSVISGTLT